MSLFFMQAVPRVHDGWLDQRQVCIALGLRPRTHAHSCAQL